MRIISIDIFNDNSGIQVAYWNGEHLCRLSYSCLLMYSYFYVYDLGSYNTRYEYGLKPTNKFFKL